MSSPSTAHAMDATLDMDGQPMLLSPLPPAQAAVLRAAYSTALAAVRADSHSDGWTFHSRQEDVDISTKKPAGSNTECSKGIGIVDAPPMVVSTLFNSPEWRLSWDQMYAGGEKVEVIDALTGISYSSFKAPWPVSGRDFCALGRSIILPPECASTCPASAPGADPVGAIFTFSASILTPLCPDKKGLVRGTLHFCGLWIEALEGDPSRSKVIYTLGSDPQGSIPKSIVNAANVKQPLCIAAIRNTLKNEPKITAEVHAKIARERALAVAERKRNPQRNVPAPELWTTFVPGAAPPKIASIAPTVAVEGAAAGAAAAAAASSSPSAASSSPASSSSSSASAVAAPSEDDNTLPPSVYDSVLDRAYKLAYAAVRAEGTTDGWTFHSRQQEVDIYMKSFPGSTVQSCKGVGFLPADVATIEMVFNDSMYRTEWDEICSSAKTLTPVDWCTSVKYSSFKAPWPVSGRDFLAVGRALDEPLGPIESKGVKFSYSASIEDAKLAPAGKNGLVRGTLHFAGLWIEPAGEKGSKIIYTLSSDPNGSIPKSIVNAANVTQPLCIAQIGKLIKNNPAMLAKMRANRMQEDRVNAKIKADHLRAKAAAAAALAARLAAGGAAIDEDIKPPASKYDTILTKAYNAALAAVRAEGATDGWTFHSRQQDVDIYMKSVPGSTVQSCKGVGYLATDVATAEMVFNDSSYRTEWDEICSASRTITWVDWCTTVEYSSFKAPWPVSGRDFLAVGRALEEPLGPEQSKGVKFSYSASIDDNKLAPAGKNGLVRGTLHFAGLWIEPAGEKRCKIIYTLSSDPNGSIPKSIVNAANVTQPLCIAQVGKLIKNNPILLAKMRVNKKQEDERSALLKAQYLRSIGRVSALGSSAAASGEVSAASIPSDPLSLPFGPVSTLLRTVGAPPSFLTLSAAASGGGGGAATQRSYYPVFDRALHLSAEHAAKVEALETASAAAPPLSQFRLLLSLLWALLLAFVWRSVPAPRTEEEDHDDIACTASPIGFLWVSPADLRQIVATFQSSQLTLLNAAAQEAAAKKDAPAPPPLPSMPQTLWIHLELLGEVAGKRQGQLIKVSFDLADSSLDSPFQCEPKAVGFDVFTPGARLGISLYSPALEIAPLPVQGAVLAVQASMVPREGAGSQMSHQSLGGALRNAFIPTGVGFDNFMHVFEKSVKKSPQIVAAAALESAVKSHTMDPTSLYRPLVLIASAQLELNQLSAPDAEHSRLGWIEVRDEEGGLASPGTISVAELLARIHKDRAATGKRQGKKKKAAKASEKDPQLSSHPLLSAAPLRTHSILLHSFYASSASASQRAEFSVLTHAPPLLPAPSEECYSLVLHTLDGTSQLVRVSALHRGAALHAYEKMKVAPSGSNLSSAASRGGRARSGASTAAPSTPGTMHAASAAPTLVAKALLVPSGHVLHACFMDQDAKRSLLHWVAQQGLVRSRPELWERMLAMETDAPLSKRAISDLDLPLDTSSGSSAALVAQFDPAGSLSPLLLVSGWHSLLLSLSWLLRSVAGVAFLLTWTDIYSSFFGWSALLICIFYPSWTAVFLPLCVCIALMRQAALQHFEAHLKTAGAAGPATEELRKAKEEARENAVGLAADLHAECCAGVSTNVLHLLYVLQCVCCWFTARCTGVVHLLSWHDETRTLGLMVLLVESLLIGMLLPLEALLLFLATCLSMHRTRVFATLINTQASWVRLHKRKYYDARLLSYPSSNVALSMMAHQLISK